MFKLFQVTLNFEVKKQVGMSGNFSELDCLQGISVVKASVLKLTDRSGSVFTKYPRIQFKYNKNYS